MQLAQEQPTPAALAMAPSVDRISCWIDCAIDNLRSGDYGETAGEPVAFVTRSLDVACAGA